MVRLAALTTRSLMQSCRTGVGFCNPHEVYCCKTASSIWPVFMCCARSEGTLAEAALADARRRAGNGSNALILSHQPDDGAVKVSTDDLTRCVGHVKACRSSCLHHWRRSAHNLHVCAMALIQMQPCPGQDSSPSDLRSVTWFVKTACRPQAEPAPAPAPRLSKAAARKAAQVARAKAARAVRSDVLASLSASALPAEQAVLLRGSASRGQRPTKKQRLRRELQAQRLGVHLEVGRHKLRVAKPLMPCCGPQSAGWTVNGAGRGHRCGNAGLRWAQQVV